MEIKDLEDQLSKFIYELETEDRLSRVGLKEKLESAKIYKKYSKLFTKETLKILDSKIKETKGSRKKEILERIYFTIAASYLGLALAKDEDAIKTYFSKAQVTVNNQKLYYFELGPKISKETIFEKREVYDDAASKVVTKANPKQLKLLKDELKLLKELGFSGYIDFVQTSKKFDYGKFYKVVQKIKKDTENIWFKSMKKISREVLKRAFVKIRSCHMASLRSLSMFDNFYPEAKVVPTFLKFVADIGLADLLPKINIDDKERPKKNPRAVCYWPDPPREIHLVIKPIGGEQDFESIFHEGGHALHGSSINPTLPYTFRALSRSNALTETYAFVLENLVFDPNWLTTYLNVSAFSGGKIKTQASFVNLMMLRRYLAKFSFEFEMFSKGLISKGPKLYKKHLDETTGFVHKEINWLSDMDSGFYSAEYLRAWIGAAQIKDYLGKKFGQKWFLNPKAGQFLRELYSRGVQDEIEDVIKQLGYRSFDTGILINSYREIPNYN